MRNLTCTLLLSGCLLLAFSSCAGYDEYARYRLLSFFFDGVPHPDEVRLRAQIAAEAALRNRKRSAKTYEHPAAVGGSGCSLCHGTKMPSNITIPPRDICIRCHTHITEGLKFIHGPAALECVFCHEVHESETRSLVRKTGDELCFDCHYTWDREAALETEEHALPGAVGRACLDCHNPHGGNNAYFLTDRYQQGATQAPVRGNPDNAANKNGANEEDAPAD